MKNSSIVSAILGGTFFAIPYLGLAVSAIPSVIIGAAAYGASELIFHTAKKENIIPEKSFQEILDDARKSNAIISKISNQIEDKKLVENINQIHETVAKIINTVEKNPDKFDKIKNFFNYYLPVTIKILNKYDEIENQELTSKESKKFMEQAGSMIEKIRIAFENQLSNLYQSDIIDTDAEMKVFDSMLKSDGYINQIDFDIKDNKK